MKKTTTFTILATMLLLCACEKDGNRTMEYEQSPNRVIFIPSDNKSAGSTILLTNIGHDGKTCTGCVVAYGETIHVDCMGFGNYCATATSVQLQQIGTDITATTTDTFDLTSEDFFLMPDRSLGFKDDKGKQIFLNIPEQMVYRDTATLQFTFTGLFYSTTAAFANI